MDEPPRKSGGAEVRGEYVMKSTRSEVTRMSVLDDYLVDPKVSMLAKSLTRNGKDCAIPIHGSISLRIEQASARAIAPKRDRARPHCWRRWPQSLWRELRARRRRVPHHLPNPGFDAERTSGERPLSQPYRLGAAPQHVPQRRHGRAKRPVSLPELYLRCSQARLSSTPVGGRLSSCRSFRLDRRTDRRHRTRGATHPIHLVRA